MSRPLRLARQMSSSLAAPRAPELHIGVVDSLQTGPPASVTVKVGGSSNTTAGVRYLASYTPAAGDLVLLALLGSDSRGRSSWVALGKFT